METKIGLVKGYDRYFIHTINPMEKPLLTDFINDVDYLSEMQIWERAEMNRRKICILEVQQKIAKVFLDRQVNFVLVKVDDLFRAKIIGKSK